MEILAMTSNTRTNALPHAVRGFTLIERLVAISIGVVIASAAYPSFSGLIGTMRAKTVGTDLYAAHRGVNITGLISVTYGCAGRSAANAAASFAVAASGSARCVSVSLSGQPLLDRGTSC